MGAQNIANGSAALEPDFSANTINITWYSNGTQLTGNNIPATCTYDDALTPPTPAARPGYVFAGWKVKDACSLSGLDATVFGTDDYNYAGTFGPSFEWTASMPYGTIEGDSRCSSIDGGVAIGAIGIPPEGTVGYFSSGYCWCRVTRYTPNSGEQCSYSDSNWVLYGYSDDACPGDCSRYCAFLLGGAMLTCGEDECISFNTRAINMRRALFGQSQ